MNAKPWTPDEWAAIVWCANLVRNPQPLPVHSLTAVGAARYAVRRLRELALQTEILSAFTERSAAARQAQRLTGGRVVHHLDGNPMNNDSANLVVIGDKERPWRRVPNR